MEDFVNLEMSNKVRCDSDPNSVLENMSFFPNLSQYHKKRPLETSYFPHRRSNFDSNLLSNIYHI